ncbi:MAG: hypothetical protein DMG34_17220 [Acidobacteria bacterium]|nr:MAG: hypothetical protein DMG34_17220 [Acidobacteriota bacterium]
MVTRERSSESIAAIYNGGQISPSRGEKVKLTDRINRIQVSPTSAVITAADQGFSDAGSHQAGGDSGDS